MTIITHPDTNVKTSSVFVNPAFANFLDWEANSRDTIDFKKVYVDMAGDLLAGLLLSQIVYWNLPSKKGVNRLTVERNGFFWLAKSRDAWWEEIRMSPREVDRSLEILRKSGLIETQLWHYHDKKTTHIRISPEGFMDAVNAVSKGDTGRAKRKFTRPQKLDPTLKSLNREILPNPEIGTGISLNRDLHITKQGFANDEIGICYISENTPKNTIREHTQRISPPPPAGGTPPAAGTRIEDFSSSSFHEQKEPEQKWPLTSAEEFITSIFANTPKSVPVQAPVRVTAPAPKPEPLPARLEPVDPEYLKEYQKARKEQTQEYMSHKRKVKSGPADWDQLARERMAAKVEAAEQQKSGAGE